LRRTDLIRFVPNPKTGFLGVATISYVAWDESTGTPGKTADTTLVKALAFSLAADTASIMVTP
jgi:hypothetical protein